MGVMHPAVLAMFADSAYTAAAMCAAGVAIASIALVAARDEIADARGLERITALRHLCVAVPLAVFGALHLFGSSFVAAIVPPYMPFRSFWVPFVGCALIGAALSIATRVAVRWSGLLFGVMMFLFVAMIHFPGALRRPHDPFIWVIVFREMSFGGAGWILAGTASPGWPERGNRVLITVGRVWITIAIVFFAVGHFLRPTGLPGVPLKMEIPAWVPARTLIDYVTGAALLAAGGSILLSRRTRIVATGVGAWLLLMLALIYARVLIGAMSDPAIGIQVQGVNYFADTLLFTGAILALAGAAPRSGPPARPLS